METYGSTDEILRLPRTTLTRIFSYLDPESLARAAAVSHQFREFAYSEDLWKTLINSYLPTPIESCEPAPSFRRLFIAFHPYWFIPQFRFWLSDEQPRGQMILAHFNTTNLCIEAWAVGATRENSRYRPWSVDPEVMIHESDMRVHVDQHRLVFRFGVGDEQWIGDEKDRGLRHARAAMMYEEGTAAVRSRVELSLEQRQTKTSFEDLAMWPMPDVSASTSPSKLPAGTSIPDSYRPRSRPTRCHPTFSLRHRVDSPAEDGSTGVDPTSTQPDRHVVGNAITYGTISPDAYATNAEKPWQGVWCGDYFDHGAELLLILQPNATNEPIPTGTVHSEETAVNSSGNVAAEDRRCKSLLAVKLTGDSNIPRWQYSFVVPDLLKDGLLRVAEEDEFRGARVVRSALHIAAKGFQISELIPVPRCS